MFGRSLTAHGVGSTMVPALSIEHCVSALDQASVDSIWMVALPDEGVKASEWVPVSSVVCGMRSEAPTVEPTRNTTGPCVITRRIACSLPWSAGAMVMVCWIWASPPAGWQVSVATPPDTAALAPDVVLLFVQFPRPLKNGSPIEVETATREI